MASRLLCLVPLVPWNASLRVCISFLFVTFMKFGFPRFFSFAISSRSLSKNVTMALYCIIGVVLETRGNHYSGLTSACIFVVNALLLLQLLQHWETIFLRTMNITHTLHRKSALRCCCNFEKDTTPQINDTILQLQKQIHVQHLNVCSSYI